MAKLWFEDCSGDMFYIEEETGCLEMKQDDKVAIIVGASDMDAFIDWLARERNNWIKGMSE